MGGKQIISGSRFNTFEDFKFNKTDKKCLKIKFKISRYGKHMETIEFMSPKTEYEAVIEMCKYMMKQIDQVWFDRVKDDTWDYKSSSETWLDHHKTRDCFLTDSVRIENVYTDSDGVVTLFISS